MKNKRTYGGGSFRKVSPGKYEFKYRPHWSTKTLYKRIECPNDKTAERLLSDWRKEQDALQAAPVKVPIELLRDLHAADKRRKGHSGRNTIHTKQRWDANIVRLLKSRDMSEFRRSDLLKYIDIRLNEEAKPATINREISAILRGLKLAQFADYCVNIPAIEKIPENNVRNGFVDREMYEAFLSSLPVRSQLLWCLAYHWGIRRNELLHLQVDWLLPTWKSNDPRLVVPGYQDGVKITKSGEPHVLPIFNDEMKGFIEMALSVRDRRCPFLHQYNGAQLTLHMWRNDYEAARKTTGLAALIPHDCRRSAIRVMLDAGISTEDAMQITGHETDSVFRRYVIRREQSAINTGVKMRKYFTDEKLVGKLVGPSSDSTTKGGSAESGNLLN